MLLMDNENSNQKLQSKTPGCIIDGGLNYAGMKKFKRSLLQQNQDLQFIEKKCLTTDGRVQEEESSTSQVEEEPHPERPKKLETLLVKPQDVKLPPNSVDRGSCSRKQVGGQHSNTPESSSSYQRRQAAVTSNKKRSQQKQPQQQANRQSKVMQYINKLDQLESKMAQSIQLRKDTHKALFNKLQ